MIGYKVYWRYRSEAEWTSIWVNSTADLSYNLEQMRPYSVYEVAVAAFRPGPGGLGQLSPSTVVATSKGLCTVISVLVIIHQLLSINTEPFHVSSLIWTEVEVP